MSLRAKFGPWAKSLTPVDQRIVPPVFSVEGNSRSLKSDEMSPVSN